MEAYTKEELLNWFTKTKGIEHYACGFYQNLAADPEIKSVDLKKTFRKISEDEKMHEELVERIISIIQNSL